MVRVFRFGVTGVTVATSVRSAAARMAARAAAVAASSLARKASSDPLTGLKVDFAGKEGGKGLRAQHRLDGGELLGLIAHPWAIAAFDCVLAGAQQHGVGDPRLRGRMLLELLFDRVQPVVELLRLGVQPDEFGDQRGHVGVAQGGCGSLGDRSGQAWHAAERAIAQHRLVLGDQAATARAGAIKLRRTLRTQARTILRVDSDTDWCQAFCTLLTGSVHDSPPPTRRDRCFGS